MLLRFRVANVRSLRDEQELSFVAREDVGGDLTAAREVPLSDGRHLPVHTVLGVFGANASGKSNVITALKNMRRAVLRSYADWTSYDGIPRDEFALDSKAAKETTLYEADFLLDGEPGSEPHGQVRWTYGFELGQRRVEAEWLYAYPKGRRQVWFERDATREKDFEFPGERLHDRARLARTTRQDALLLTRAANDGHEQLTPVFDWFKDNLWDVTPETERAQREDYTAMRLLRSEDFRRRAQELLRVADLGIADVEVEQSASGRPVVSLVHTGSGERVALDWSSESWGTRSWFALIGPLLLALDTGAVLLVDELDSSLHPRFAAEVVRLFQAPWVNPKGAQLVFTGHDPSLLRTPGGGRLLQPGQVWLTEKDERGATSLSSVAEWEPTEEEDLMTSYLAGSFGAVPKVSEGQIGRRLLRTDDIARMEAEEV
ncbi:MULTISPECIES: ATP/GTP-binding protein [unclassified Streptomyces]|uniref:AAA family ATPase n=1 Tax=unclassified Streptomyces TaxID=2593676 RepID=UPI000DD676D5|nr:MULTISPECIES: ATP-binding protein [unclassified Streptomyces]QZZ29254.1 ATP-binding protein [Streptomyces sp. ST1015]